MINLNKKDLSKEIIFEYLTSFDIFSFYIPSISINRPVLSPLRKNDHNPSFSIFKHPKKEVLIFKDFGTGEVGDCIKFVSRFYDIDYYGALSQIAIDFGFAEDYRCSGHSVDRQAKGLAGRPCPENEYKPTIIKITLRQWNQRDLTWWKSYGITLPTLTAYRVVPISDFFINQFHYVANFYAYAYIEKKDEIATYKIYQPFSHKTKWRTNAPYSVHQGYSQLPKKDKLLIITKSLKDVMSLKETAKITAIGLQAESIFIKEQVINEYTRRFTKVVCLFDNTLHDSQGKKLATKYAIKYHLPSVFIPETTGCKDYSDLVQKKGPDVAKVLLMKELNQLKNE